MNYLIIAKTKFCPLQTIFLLLTLNYIWTFSLNRCEVADLINISIDVFSIIIYFTNKNIKSFKA